MKKVTKVLSALLPSLFVTGMAIGLVHNLPSMKEDPGQDTAIYTEGDSVVSLDQSVDRNYAEDEDEDEDVTVEVDKVILHYYNEAGGNEGENGRAFYLWVTGVDGFEYNTSTRTFKEDHNPNGIVKVTEEDKMMTITIDFINDAEHFGQFANRSGMYFIIKYAMKSDTDLNWGGQSDDMFIRYADYPDAINDKVCELWTMNAAGGGIAILDKVEKTKVHGVALARFTDWKTISCQLTSDTKSVNWKLYAYDQTYYKIKPKKRAENQKWYLVKEGTGTGNFQIKLKYEAHINVVYSLESHDPSTDSQPGMAELNKVVTVGLNLLYDSEKFHTYYEDANKDTKLGVTYTSTATTFRVWSPVSANVKVHLYDKDTTSEYCGSTDEDTKKAYDKYDAYQMQYTTGGIWELTIEGDLSGKYYCYQVDNSLGTNLCMDPYATSAGANGLRALIYDKNGKDVTPDGWNELPTKWDGVEGYDIETPQELTIYEVHIQDFTSDDSWNGTKENAGKYNGFVERNTKLAEPTGNAAVDATGYDHLNYLGVKAVQIMPTFDHDNNEVDTNGQKPKYNWGYNPLNYNVPEGVYSSDPHNGFARVKEFRNLVLEMSKTDVHTRVIMDVVYNHVSSATGSNFHKLMPRYYFRYAMQDYHYSGDWGESTVHEGELWDGSGCHNEVASERTMMRKFIVDSLCMWATDYKIKGFRFDLMGLIDFQTLVEAKKALHNIDKDIYMYGEGWEGTANGYHGPGSTEYNMYYGGTPHNFGAEKWQIYNECNNFITDGIYLGSFNNTFRDTLKGSNDIYRDGEGHFTGLASGWIQNGNWSQNQDGWYYDEWKIKKVASGLWGTDIEVYGATGRFPEQTVSYVSCHDNWTIVEQLTETLLSRGYDKTKITDFVLRASMQLHALVMQSNSAAFILGGEELMRSKKIPDVSKITDLTSYVDMYGGSYSHNSYNSPIEVNSFKWNNKKSITISGDYNGPFTSTIENGYQDPDVDKKMHYIEKFAELIKSHQNVNFKRGENVANAYEFIKIGEDVWLDNMWWHKDGNEDKKVDGVDNRCNVMAFNMNNTHVHVSIAGAVGGEADYSKDGDKLVELFCYGFGRSAYVYTPNANFGVWIGR